MTEQTPPEGWTDVVDPDLDEQHDEHPQLTDEQRAERRYGLMTGAVAAGMYLAGGFFSSFAMYLIVGDWPDQQDLYRASNVSQWISLVFIILTACAVVAAANTDLRSRVYTIVPAAGFMAACFVAIALSHRAIVTTRVFFTIAEFVAGAMIVAAWLLARRRWMRVAAILAPIAGILVVLLSNWDRSALVPGFLRDLGTGFVDDFIRSMFGALLNVGPYVVVAVAVCWAGVWLDRLMSTPDQRV